MQQRNSVFALVTSLITRYADLAPGQELHSETRIDETSIDSLSAFEIIFEIEERQGIELDEITLSKIRTIGDLVDVVTQELAGHPGAPVATTSNPS